MKELGAGSAGGGDGGSGKGLEARALDRYLDDLEWEAREEREVDEAEGRGESAGETAAEDSESVTVVTVLRRAGLRAGVAVEAMAPS